MTSAVLTPATWEQYPGMPMTTPPPGGGLNAVDVCGLQLDADNDGRPEPMMQAAFTLISLASLPECAWADPLLSFRLRARIKTDVSNGPSLESVPDVIAFFPSDSAASAVPLTPVGPGSYIQSVPGYPDLLMPDPTDSAVWNVFAGLAPEGAAGPDWVEIEAIFSPTTQMFIDGAITVMWVVGDGLACYGGLDIVASYDDAACAPVSTPCSSTFDWRELVGLPPCGEE